MHSSFYRMVAGAIVALSLLGSVGVAQASSLTPTQVSAIISLLQAFGADQSVIANVQATLNGQSTTGVVSSVSCSAFSGLKYGDKDTTMSGQVSRLQAFLGISPTTGYYGVLTRTAYGNKCINNNAQPTAVAGMSKYTDADFGFSFWYPSGLEIENRTTNSDGSSFVSNYGSNTKVLRVISAKDNFLIEEVYSPDTSLYYQESPGPFGSDFDHYYFNSQTHTWMDVNDGGPTGKYSGGTQAADISKNTMGGLHMFYGYVRFSSGYVIPLSAQHFLFISRLYGNADNTAQFNALVSTIVATNPSVATPVSTVQQIQTIQAEASAYGVSSPSSVVPSATIDQSSLTSSSGNPTLTGEAHGVSKIHLSIGKNGGTVDSLDVTVDSNGHWSAYVASNNMYSFSTLSPTTYGVNVSDGNTGKSLMNGAILIITNPVTVTQTYTNSQYGFSVQYPNGLNISTSPTTAASYVSNMSAGTQVAVIGPITKGFTAVESGWGDNGYVTTSGKVTLYVSTNSTDIANCMVTPQFAEDGPFDIANKTISGISYLTYSVGGPAMGLFGYDYMYKTLHNGVCYAVDAQVAGGESGHMNATDAAANDAVIKQVTDELTAVVQSFRFTN